MVFFVISGDDGVTYEVPSNSVRPLLHHFTSLIAVICIYPHQFEHAFVLIVCYMILYHLFDKPHFGEKIYVVCLYILHNIFSYHCSYCTKLYISCIKPYCLCIFGVLIIRQVSVSPEASHQHVLRQSVLRSHGAGRIRTLQ